MSAAMCKICGYQVYAQDARNVLATQDGETDCPPPFWVVRIKRKKVAVATFFRDYNGQTAEKRAKEMAKKKSEYTAVQISPHGHQIK
jgi:hypothetical protein